MFVYALPMYDCVIIMIIGSNDVSVNDRTIVSELKEDVRKHPHQKREQTPGRFTSFSVLHNHANVNLDFLTMFSPSIFIHLRVLATSSEPRRQ